MRHSGPGFAQGTLRAWVRGNLAHSTCPDEAGVDGRDAGTERNVREAMYGAWAVEVDVHGMVQEDTHWGAVSRNHVGALRGSGSTRSRHPLPVAVQAERARYLHAHQCCYSQTGFVAGSCCSRW
jgi:hypothetical protein